MSVGLGVKTKLEVDGGEEVEAGEKLGSATSYVPIASPAA